MGRYPLECVEGDARRPKENRLQLDLRACFLAGVTRKCPCRRSLVQTRRSRPRVVGITADTAPTATLPGDLTTRWRDTTFGDAPERRQQAYSDFESPASSDEATALMSVQDAPPQQRNVKLIGALSNLSIQYNFSAIAIALAFMDNTGGNKSSGEPAAAYPRTEAQAALLKSLVFAGASNCRCRALLLRGRCCATPASRCH